MLAPGSILQQRYQIISQLGKGGMGTVYEAIDLRLDATVALKETHFTDERMRRQFEREARLLARLRHPAMTKVIDHFNEGEGQYLVMEFIAGDDLSKLMQMRAAPFAPAEVLRWGNQLLDALEYLHCSDPPVIHRDIKPQNIKLTRQGQIILLDFGLAKGFAGQTSHAGTSASIFGFTPNYAPLEQIQGMGTDARSDLYSLAATLYHLITGVAPPDALTRITAVANDQPDPLRQANELNPLVTPALAAVFAQAMMQNREKRPANAAEMRRMLGQAAESLTPTPLGEAQTIRPTPSSQSKEPPVDLSSMSTVFDQDAAPAQAPRRSSFFAAMTSSSSRLTWIVGGTLALLFVGIIVPVLFMLRGVGYNSLNPSGDGSRLGRPLRVGIVTWPGYAGGIVANNGFKPNKDCIFWTKHNLQVEFLLLEDIDVRNRAFARGGLDGVDIIWSSVDYFANELPGFNKDGVKARAIMQVDWSRGGDAIVADQSIKRVEDLKDKRIALALFTPSHWLLEYYLESPSLSETEQAEIIKNLVGKISSPDARADFVAKKVDAAVLWEPDITEALQKRPGSHVLFSTETATNLLADIMVAREDFIKEHPDVIKAFVEGWLNGTAEANRRPDLVVRLLMENEPLYKDLGESATRNSLQTVRWADLSDNTKMFGLDGSEPWFDRLFESASQAWLKRGYISRAVLPDQARDISFLKDIYVLSRAAITKPVNILFMQGSSTLDETARKAIDERVALFVQTYPNDYIRIEGNTDDQESRLANINLSQARAQAVADYLAQRYKINPSRFIIIANGHDKPLASNSTPEGRAQNRRTDISIIPAQ